MKKPFILFILFVLLLVVAKKIYHEYCEANPESCKAQKYDDTLGSPKEGIDW